MCGRYVIYGPDSRLIDAFDIREMPPFLPRYNVAPQSEVLVLSQRPDGARVGELVRWGLVPAWAKAASIGVSLINARAESVATKPAFRSAFLRTRCIVPANGFYEWRTVPGAARKQPHYVHPTEWPFFGFAGLLERWHGPDGVVRSCAIVTCEANETMAPIHERMPCILEPQDYGRWLDPAQHDPPALQALLRPVDPRLVATRPIDPAVGNTRNEGPALILPASNRDGSSA